MVAEQVNIKGFSRAGIKAVRLNVKDFLPQRADEATPFLSIEEPRLSVTLKQLQTTRQPIIDQNVISGHSVEDESERFTSLSKVILHHMLSMTEGESHALVQSFIHTACGYEMWRHFKHSVLWMEVQGQGSTPTSKASWGSRNSAAEMLKHHSQWLQTIQEHETTHKTRISDDIKIASVVNSVRGQLVNHMLLNMNYASCHTTSTRLQTFLSTYVIQHMDINDTSPMRINQSNGFKGKKCKGKSKGPPQSKARAGESKDKESRIRSNSGVRI
eukprot:101311-Amphidinium_carterae.2